MSFLLISCAYSFTMVLVLSYRTLTLLQLQKYCQISQLHHSYTQI